MQFKNSKMTYASHSYIDFVSDAGTASVNASVTELIFRYSDMEMGEGTFKMGLSHIYNNYCHIADTFMGNNWKLNIQQYIKPYDVSMKLEDFNVGDYLYIDGEGYIHRFVRYDNNRYLDTLGNGMTLVTANNAYKIEDAQKNILEFNSAGNLIKISKAGNPCSIDKDIEYDNFGRPIKYYDSRCTGKKERYFKLEYMNSLLYKLSLINKGKELECIYYNYSGMNLVGIHHFINNALSQVALFKYDYSNQLIFTTSTPNGLALKFTPQSSSIIVEKAISKIYLNSFASLNDDLYSGEISPIPFQEPEIGSNDTIKSYNSFGLSNDSIVERTTFYYNKSYSLIKSDKNIEYRYYHNKKGFVTGVFEVEGKHLRTLTKDNGISIMSEMPKDYAENTINNKGIVTATISESIKCLDKNNIDCGLFTGGKTLKEYRDKDGLNYINFVASFWINVSCTNATYMKISFKIYQLGWISKEIFIDKTANNAWQYVTVPISILDDSQSKTYDFSTAYIKLLTDGTGSYQISDFRIKECEKSTLLTTSIGAWLPSISEFYSFRVVMTNGTSKTILLDQENFLTDSDILNSNKNYMLRDNEGFDFIYCGNRKRIANVSKIFLKAFKEHQTGVAEEYDITDDNITYKSCSSDNSCVTNKIIFFYKNQVEEYSEYYVNRGYSGGDNSKIISDLQGRTLETVDVYKKKTVNEYDRYGNLISTTTALEEDFDSNNQVKPGRKKFYTKYVYDDESENGKYREMVIDTKVQNASLKIKKNSLMLNTVDSIQIGNNYSQCYTYDILNRIQDQSISFDYNKKVFHHFEYDSLGRIKAVADNDQFKFGFDYDSYGNIKKYYIEKNKESIDIKSKSVTPNGSSFGGDMYEEYNYFTYSKIITENDKYGRPKKILRDKVGTKKSVEFEYQEEDIRINNTEFSTFLSESQSIAKVKYIKDNYDQTKTTFWYDNNNDACGYKVEQDKEEILRIQQLDAQNTKYVIGDKHYKISVEKNDIYADPRITKTSVFDDTKYDGKDEWAEVPRYSFSYDYDNVLGVVKKKSNSDSSLELDFIPNDNLGYYSSSVQKSTHKLKNLTYQYDYGYDENENLKKIHATQNGYTDITYSYDKLNRLKTEYNSRHSIDYIYSYLDDNDNDMNRVTKVFQGTTKVKELKYDDLKRLTKCYKNSTLTKELKYRNHNLLPKAIVNHGKTYDCGWIDSNRLNRFGDIYYTYNYQGNRVEKWLSSGIRVKYYYDGSKLLGEDYSNGIKLRYMYDLMGISGVRYMASDGKSIDYDYAKDGQGNIVAVIKDGTIITEYFYDAWGNTKVNILNNSDPIANLNPIRWRGHYYDSETEMYFINGRYYDPELCSYIDFMDIETVLDSSNTIGALNLNAICTDNPTDLGANSFTVLTNTDLMPDPVYDPLAGYSWWDRNWKSVIRYGLFALTFTVSIILMCIPGTQAFGIGMFTAGLGAAISGAIIGGIIGGIISAIQGNCFFKGFVDSAITGFVDGFTAGAILYCVSSAVSAISKSIKAANQAVPKADTERLTSGLNELKKNKIRDAARRLEKGNYNVYLSTTDDYVGITNSLERRSVEHFVRSGRNIEPLVKNVSKESARVIEQTVIEHVGRVCKGTGTLLNKINSIASSNPLYASVKIFKAICCL